MVSLNDKLVKKQADDGDAKAKKLYAFLSQPGRFLATIQIGITFAGFLASAIAAESFADQLVILVSKTGIPVSAAIIKSVSVILITIFLSYFTLVFGELLPKNVAMQYSEKIANAVVGPLAVLSKITNPFVNLLTASTNFFIKLFGGNPSQLDRENITEEEIRMMMDVGEENGVIQNSEKEMIDNIFKFDDIYVSEIMTHRINVVGIPINLGFKEVLEIMNRDKYTRVPVYQSTIDNIVGILHVKDLLQFMGDNQEDFKLSRIIRKPYFVPESKKIDKLFSELQKNKVHLAVVIDEYGGTAGIVTIEDLLEEIVGNIFDEYDIEHNEFECIDSSTFIFDGIINLEKVSEVLGMKFPEEQYDTLGGFIMGELGQVPAVGEKPILKYGNIVFEVLELEGKRFIKIKANKCNS